MTMTNKLRAIVLAAAAFAANASLAEEAAPAVPAAGPTKAAAEAFCGEPTAKADELFARYSKGKESASGPERCDASESVRTNHVPRREINVVIAVFGSKNRRSESTGSPKTP